jgi:hypothetical protein
MDEEEQYRINAFDWEAEFPEVFNSGTNKKRKGPSTGSGQGFDAVIGNPPYIHSRSELISESEKNYYYEKYKSLQYQINTYGLFLERGLNILKESGLQGMIIPNYWISTDYDRKLRKLLFLDNRVIEIVNTYNVFAKVIVDTLMLFVEKLTDIKYPREYIVKSIDRRIRTIDKRLLAIKNEDWSFLKANAINFDDSDIRITFFNVLKLESAVTLSKYFYFRMGMKPYERGKGVPAQSSDMIMKRVYDSNSQIDESYKKLLKARNVMRYFYSWDGNWVKYGKNLAAPRNPSIFGGNRILVRRILSQNQLFAAFCDENIICNTDIIIMKPNPDVTPYYIKFFLGILNSRVCSTFIKTHNINVDRAVFPKINVNTLEYLPVPCLEDLDQEDKSIYDRIVKLVDRMLDLYKKLSKAETPHDREVLQRQIDATDRRIDRLVYELYGLTEEEIRLIEESVDK